MEQRYRENYDGEYVIVDTVWKNSRKLQSKEFLPNPISNQHISGRAAVIGTNESGRNDIVVMLASHKGGLLGQHKLQTYGCEGVWRHMPLDFCVENDANAIKEMVNSGYVQNTVVYSRIRNCLEFPGSCYHIPYGVRLRPCAQAAYLAAFDGHREVFLLSVDGINPHTVVDTQSVIDLAKVFKTYSNTQFRLVTDDAMPDDNLREFVNVEVWNHRQFVTYCDV